MTPDDLPVYTALDELVRLIERGAPVFVRWSRGPAVDLGEGASRDQLTGAPLPGLSASPLDVEDWWHGQPARLWVARRLYDYSHLREEKGTDVHPWVLLGQEAARGPDNEPLVREVRPVAWIADSVIDEARDEVARQPGPWGPMSRPPRLPLPPRSGPEDRGRPDGEGRPGAAGAA